MMAIRGAGGLSGTQSQAASVYTPTTARDTLNSEQYGTIIDLVSEGEIEGLVNGYQSVFLDNTPLQNADGSYNFPGTTVDYRYGTQDQSYVPLSSAVENEKQVNLKVDFSSPVTRTITSAQVDAVRVTISIPQLQYLEAKGDVTGAEVSFSILLQFAGGGFTYVLNDKIKGRTGDKYEKSYVINFSDLASNYRDLFPIDVRLERGSFNSNQTDSRLFNDIYWSSYTEVTYAKLRYPNTAIVVSRFLASEFSTIPQRSYRIRGIKIKIPSNATVDQTNGRLIYSGIWNGTFGAAQWCSDPAWVLWDLLVSTRYGFGDHIKAEQLDRWAFYACSRYCSELVPDGYGGFEPRFSCNVNIQTAEDAYKLINDLVSVFRSMPYWSTGALTVSQDAPQDPAYGFTLANVTEEGFSYQGGSLKTRPTVVVVSWLNLDTRAIDYEVVEDQDAIKKYGVITRDVSAFACTSRGQAHRLGKWLLYSEWNEGEIASFAVSIDAGVVARPGQVVEISDPVRAGQRRGGRIATATTTAVTVDDATDLPDSGGTLSVVLPDGTLESRPIQSRAGSVITVSPGFSAVPNSNSIWIYQTSDLQTSTWRVLTVQEQDGIRYAINAIAYNASKYAFVEQGIALQQRDVTNLNEAPDSPINLQATETLYEQNGRALSKLVLSWQAPPGVSEFRIRWRSENGNWTTDQQRRFDYQILNTTPGRYEIEVYSISPALKQSVLPASLSFLALGKTAAPATPTGVNIIPSNDATAILSWDRSTELDVLLGGKVLIRHSVLLSGATWAESQEIVAAAAGSQTQKVVPLLEGTYLIKFEDDSGNRSAEPATAAVDLPSPQPRLLVRSYREDQESPPFNGNSVNMVYDAGLDGLILAPGILLDSLAVDGNWDALGAIDSGGSLPGTGEYEFGSTFDLGGVFDLNLRRYFVTRPYAVGDLWDDRIALIDDWGPIDGDALDQVNAALYVRTTNDTPSGSAVWSDWREFTNALYRGRAFQFKVLARSDSSDQNIIIDELGAELELQQRTETAGSLTSGVGPYVVTYPAPFYQPPAVGITAYNMNSGEYYVISSQSRTGFTITFYNSSAAVISRNFSYLATGYGREII
jgi:predicted phage tail protein